MTEQRVETSESRPPPDESGTPPVRSVSPGQWLRENLFNTWYNALLTLLLAPLAVYVLFTVGRFVLVTGRWEIIEVNLTNLMVGTFPRGELWRLWVAIAILGLVVGLGLGVTAQATAVAAAERGAASAGWLERARRFVPVLLLLAVVVIFVRTATPLLLLVGCVAIGVAAYLAGRRLPPRARRWANAGVIVGLLASYAVIAWIGGGVPAGRWGGLLLTMFLAVGGIALSYPLGVLLALGRRSTLPIVRVVCVVYIELMRGVPLIALLFMGWLILPFFLPVGFPTPSVTWRALIIFILFTAAYVAEIVRGGLQSVPRGQSEAAHALGLRSWKVTRLVVLPQALRNVIPATVGQFISLYKDTSLVFVVGLLDLLRVGTRITSQPDFLGQGLHAETLLFVSFIYWVGSYWMSRESQRLERKLGLGER